MITNTRASFTQTHYQTVTGSERHRRAGQAQSGPEREETPLERLDRNLEEMTGELRVVVTGVQVLFAFLLIVPFDIGFAHAGSFERTVYFVTLLLAALAAACTIAPSAQHRFLFRYDDKRHLVFISNRIVIAGLGFLALAMSGCLLLVAAKLFGVRAGILAVTVGVVPFLALWFAMPLWRRAKLDRDQRRDQDVADRSDRAVLERPFGGRHARE